MTPRAVDRILLRPVVVRPLLVIALAIALGACTPPPGAIDVPPEGGDPAAPAADAPLDDESEPTSEEPDPAPEGEPQAAPVTLQPGCTATAKLGGYPTWFFFTRPDKPCTGTPGSGIDRHALDELTRLIRSVPAGGRIDGHIFSITVDSVAQALVDAQTKGVDVRISTDGGVAASTDTLTAAFLRS